MAITRVGQSTALSASTSSTSTSVSRTISVGDAVIVILGAYSASAGNPTACTDNGGNSYTLVQSYNSAGPKVWMYACIATAPATTVTVTHPTGYRRTLIVANYDNVDSIGANNGVYHNATTSKTESITQTLASVNNWMVAGLIHQNTGNPTVSTGTLLTYISDTTNSVLAIDDNTGGTSLTCANSYATAAYESGISVELVASTGSTDATATPSGAQSTSATGAPSGSVYGTGSTGSLSAGSYAGTVIATVDTAEAIVGVSGSSAAGTPTPSGNASTNVSGVTGSCAIGTVIANGGTSVDATASITGLVSGSSAGSPAPIVAQTVAITGIALISARTAPGATGDATAAPTSTSTTSVRGTLTAVSSSDVIAYPSGIQASSVCGSPLPSIAATATITGVQITASASLPAAKVNAAAVIPSAPMVSAYTAPAISADAGRSPPSVMASCTTGLVSSAGDSQVAIYGAQAQSSAGTVTAAFVPLPPEPVDVHALTIEPAIDVRLSAQPAVTVPAITIHPAVHVDLSVSLTD